MKKVLHIAIESAFYKSDGIRKGWEANGYEHIQINWQELRYGLGTEGMRKSVLQAAGKEVPSVIFLHCQNPEAFDVATIRELQNISHVINYTYDTREDISWYKEIAPHITLTVFPSRDEVKEVEDTVFNHSGKSKVMYLPSSADFDVYKPGEPSGNGTQEIVFIGNNFVDTNLNYPQAQQRDDMVKFLIDTYGKRFKAFGRGWGKHAIIDHTIVDNKKEIDIYRSCKIAITHNNFIREGYCSDRSWRATGTGACTIHHNFEGVRELFGYGDYVPVWENFNDLKYNIDWFLKNERERDISARTVSSYVRDNHRWEDRVRAILKRIS